MVWIKTTLPEHAEGRLAASYRKLGAPPARLDQIILAHSERPHTLDGHMAIYRSVLHDRANTLGRAFAEAIGILVSQLNGCSYCVSHHAHGLAQALADETRCESWLEALRSGNFRSAFDPRQALALDYARKLTITPAEIAQADVDSLRLAGWDDGCILEINQITAYFAYANRTVLGLGVNLADELNAPDSASDPHHAT